MESFASTTHRLPHADSCCMRAPIRNNVIAYIHGGPWDNHFPNCSLTRRRNYCIELRGNQACSASPLVTRGFRNPSLAIFRPVYSCCTSYDKTRGLRNLADTVLNPGCRGVEWTARSPMRRIADIPCRRRCAHQMSKGVDDLKLSQRSSSTRPATHAVTPRCGLLGMLDGPDDPSIFSGFGKKPSKQTAQTGGMGTVETSDGLIVGVEAPSLAHDAEGEIAIDAERS